MREQWCRLVVVSSFASSCGRPLERCGRAELLHRRTPTDAGRVARAAGRDGHGCERLGENARRVSRTRGVHKTSAPGELVGNRAVPHLPRGVPAESSHQGSNCPKNDKSPDMRGLRSVRRRGLEPPPGYPGPGPQPGNGGVISVWIAPDRPYRPTGRTIRMHRMIWMLPRLLPRAGRPHDGRTTAARTASLGGATRIGAPRGRADGRRDERAGSRRRCRRSPTRSRT
jgi:hypothetical protein